MSLGSEMLIHFPLEANVKVNLIKRAKQFRHYANIFLFPSLYSSLKFICHSMLYIFSNLLLNLNKFKIHF
jgi:hypothetical protein